MTGDRGLPPERTINLEWTEGGQELSFPSEAASSLTCSSRFLISAARSPTVPLERLAYFHSYCFPALIICHVLS